ncbi:lysin A [Rhodococcus phage Reynauld]|uniref:Lysin A n=1 Tax=Rhodococcus phage Reynauld TaxID=3062845 RepID=A0ACD4ULH0_9CAUD|nr:lysin A [Rhodococcus phage Reynauld]
MQEIDHTGISPNHSGRYGARIRLGVGHTQEGNGTKESLGSYLKNPASQVSYHYTIDNSGALAIVDTDRASWSCLDANSYTINYCYAGSFASWDRATWLSKMGDAIDCHAWLWVRDAAKYKVATDTRSWDELRRGLSGATDHWGITAMGIGNHTDLGKNYPWDRFRERVSAHLKGAELAPAPKPVPVPHQIDIEAERAREWIGKRITVGTIPTPDGIGQLASFERGHIYWTPLTGAHAIPNMIFETYADRGFETSPLGYPVGDHTVLTGPDGNPWADVQGFQGGAIYRRYDSEGHTIWGQIRETWNRSGFENGPLGFPVTDEIRSSTGVVQQRFERGRILWNGGDSIVLTPVGGEDQLLDIPH